MHLIWSSTCLVLVGFCLQNVCANYEQEIQIWQNSNLYPQTELLLRRRKQINLTAIVVQAVTNLQGYMKNGNSTLGIPVLEPLVFNQTLYDVTSTERVIKLNGSVDGRIDGLTGFTIKSCLTSLAGLWASVTLEFGEVKASGTYTASGLIADIVPVEGQGRYNLTLSNVTATLEPQCTGEDTSEKLKQFKVSCNIGDTQIAVDGLMGQMSDVIKEFLQDAEQAIVRRSLSWLEATLEQSAIEFSGNTVFKDNMTDVQLIEYLQQF